jgi:predicted CoA-binding protein
MRLFDYKDVLCVDENKLIVVVGVSENPDKFGCKIFTNLLGTCFKAVAVGVRCDKVAGQTVYKSLKNLPTRYSFNSGSSCWH